MLKHGLTCATPSQMLLFNFLPLMFLCKSVYLLFVKCRTSVWCQNEVSASKNSPNHQKQQPEIPPPHTHTHTKPVEKQGKLRDDCLAWVHLARGWIIVKWSSWPCIRAVWKYLWQSNAIVGAKMRSRVVSGWVQESREQDLACLL